MTMNRDTKRRLFDAALWLAGLALAGAILADAMASEGVAPDQRGIRHSYCGERNVPLIAQGGTA